jgi:flagellar protein FliO/FliZ
MPKLFRSVVGLVVLPFAIANAADGGKTFAAPAAAPVPSGNVANIGQVTLSLLLVLAAVFAVAWMLRRMKVLNRRGAHHLEVVAELPLGAKERAVLLRAGKKHVLVGVTQTQISALHVLAADDVGHEPVSMDTSASASNPSFKSLLRQSLGLK